MEYLNQIIQTTISSFDFSFCVVINIFTYIMIKVLDDINGDKHVNTWIKRLVFLLVTVVVSLLYHFAKMDDKLILNSAIISPVFWSWIVKPIMIKLGIDYRKKIDENNVVK